MPDLFVEFQTLYNQKCFTELIAKANSFAIKPGTDPILSKYLAASYFSVGEYRAAESILIQLESSFSNDPNFLSLFAATSRRLSNFDRASQLFEKALLLEPKSLQVRNNYANLLIDLEKFAQAKELLEDVLLIDPSYSDAKSNLDRLLLLSSTTNQLSVSHKTVADDLVFDDPLLFAFDKSEVDYSQKRYKLSRDTSNDSHQSLRNLPDPNSRQVALEQLNAAYQANEERRFDLALKLCSQIFRVLGPYGQLYDLVSDTYLNLNRYQEAEIYILHAVSVDGLSLKRCFNLASFSSMRGDSMTANYYLNKAGDIDPSSPDLVRLKALVSSKSKEVKTIFDFSNKFEISSLSRG